MSQEYKKVLQEKFDSFSIAENKELKKLLKFEVWNILKKQNKLDSDDYHIWGLTYYETDDDVEYNISLALEKFLYAIELDDGHFLARLYAAHCFHDKKNYDNALMHYQKVDRDELKKFQIWRYVKLIEQIGFCHYTLGRKQIGEQHFKEVLDWYSKLPDEDRAVPSEMLSCLPEDHKYVLEMKKLEDYLE